MFNKKLISLVEDSKYYISGAVLCSWAAMIFQIIATHNISSLLNAAIENTITSKKILITTVTAFSAIAIRFLCDLLWNYFSYCSSRNVKKNLRELI